MEFCREEQTLKTHVSKRSKTIFKVIITTLRSPMSLRVRKTNFTSLIRTNSQSSARSMSAKPS